MPQPLTKAKAGCRHQNRFYFLRQGHVGNARWVVVLPVSPHILVIENHLAHQHLLVSDARDCCETSPWVALRCSKAGTPTCPAKYCVPNKVHSIYLGGIAEMLGLLWTLVRLQIYGHWICALHSMLLRRCVSVAATPTCSILLGAKLLALQAR